MASSFVTMIKSILPTGRGNPVGVSSPPTYQPASPNFMTPRPWYRDHLLDITDARDTLDAQQLMEVLFRSDPDTSAAVHAYLTVADTQPLVEIRDFKGEYALDAYDVWHSLVLKLTTSFDLTKGYTERLSLQILSEHIRHLILLRGGSGLELVTDANFVPTELRMVDPYTMRWFEKIPGRPTAIQYPRGGQDEIDLNIPTFFYTGYHNSPISRYATSPFISAINTIAARQQIINDLYRIMQLTGYPRLDVSIVQDVIKNSAPADIKADPRKLRAYMDEQIFAVRGGMEGARPDEAFVHTDATVVSVINDKSSGATLNIDSVLKTLNAQNQAGLKTVSTILGRGESGVNTASVESRVFSMHADALNVPVGYLLSRAFTTAFQLLGYPVTVEIKFRPSELRPETELEPQLITKQTRLLELLSMGIINDNQFSMQMFGKLPNKDAPKLSGTNFLIVNKAAVNTDNLSPNNDPLGRSVTGDNPNAGKSNAVGGPGSAQGKAKKKAKATTK